MSKKSARAQGLKVGRTRNRLVISIGFKALRLITENAPAHLHAIGDSDGLFAKKVAKELERESNGCMTDVQRALHAAIWRVVLLPAPSA